MPKEISWTVEEFVQEVGDTLTGLLYVRSKDRLKAAEAVRQMIEEWVADVEEDSG